MSEPKIQPWIPAVIVAALGYFVDVYDLWVFGIVRTASLTELGVSGDDLTTTGVLLMDIQLAGMMIGAVLFGKLGDKRGRLGVLLGSILLYSGATLANGFVTSVWMYGVLRFLAGIGLAGEIGGGITLVSELVPTRLRGYATTVVATVGVSGAIVAGLVGDLLPWRWAYITGGVAGLMLLFLRVSLRESTLFATVRKDSSVEKGSFKLLLQTGARFKRYVACIVVGIPIWYCAGILAAFAPEVARSMEVAGAVTVGKTLMYLTIGMAIMDVGSGLISQWWQSRKKPIILFVLACGVLTYTLLTQKGITPSQFYTEMFLLGLTLGYWAVLITTAAEQFGTNLRALVTTTVPNFVRGSAVILTLVFEGLRGPLGTLATVQLIGGVTIAAALVAALSLKETFHRDLDFVDVREGGEAAASDFARAA